MTVSERSSEPLFPRSPWDTPTGETTISDWLPGAISAVAMETGSGEGHYSEGGVGDPSNDVVPGEITSNYYVTEHNKMVTYNVSLVLLEQLKFPMLSPPPPLSW